MKKVSIVIPVRNEEKYIESCMRSILKFDYPYADTEIFFVDGMSSDKTAEIVGNYTKKYPHIRLLKNEQQIVPVAMNIGIREAKGDYVVRLDAHAEYPTDYISKLLEWSLKLDADNVGAVCLTDTISDSQTAQAIKFVMSDKFGVGNSKFRTGTQELLEVDTVPFGFYKRDVFKRIGLYDERLIRTQDLELNKRLKNAGGKIYLVPDVKCTYFAREDFKSFYSNRFLTGKWVILAAFYTNRLGSVSIRHLVPLVFVMMLAFFAASSFFCGYAFFTLLTLLFGYSGILYFRAYDITKSPALALSILKAYFVLHMSYGLGSLCGIVSMLMNKLKIKLK